jgi:hypothetical protein
MQYILIIHPPSMLSSIRNNGIHSDKWDVEELGTVKSNQISIKSSIDDCFVRLELTTKLPNEDFDYTEEELIEFSSLFGEVEVTFIKYSGLHALREVLNILSQNFDFYIDNDHGLILRNNDFMDLWNKNLTWDWVRDSLE